MTANQVRVKMEAFASIPQLDKHAAARMITLGSNCDSEYSIIAIMYIKKNILKKSPTYIIICIDNGYIIGEN